jgi:hypothetical protein
MQVHTPKWYVSDTDSRFRLAVSAYMRYSSRALSRDYAADPGKDFQWKYTYTYYRLPKSN